jgi:hypothetical protein
VPPAATTRRACLRVRRHGAGRARVNVDLLRRDGGGVMPAAERLELAHRGLEVRHDGPRVVDRGPQGADLTTAQSGVQADSKERSRRSRGRRIASIRRAPSRRCGPPRTGVRQAALQKPSAQTGGLRVVPTPTEAAGRPRRSELEPVSNVPETRSCHHARVSHAERKRPDAHAILTRVGAARRLDSTCRERCSFEAEGAVPANG